MGAIDIGAITEKIIMIVNSYKNHKKDFFERYIAPTYEDIEKVYIDYIKILFEAEKNVEERWMDVRKAIEYLKTSRIENQALRQSLYSRTIIISTDSSAAKDLAMFALGVRGILQGGMSGTYSKNNDFILNQYLTQHKIEGDFLFYEGMHTILDIIKEFEGDKRNYDYISLEKDRKKFIDTIEIQKRSIERYWKVTTLSYEKIRYEVYK